MRQTHFFGRQEKTYRSEAQRSALKALISRTGDQSKDIVLALATNRPGDLDSAVADRIDEVLEFPLPGEDERFKLLKLYLDKYIARAGERKSSWFKQLFRRQQQKIEIKGLDDEVIREAASRTDEIRMREEERKRKKKKEERVRGGTRKKKSEEEKKEERVRGENQKKKKKKKKKRESQKRKSEWRGRARKKV